MEQQYNLIQFAEEFLLKYFSDGKERKPEDFDNEILGGIDYMGLLSPRGPAWNRTPFCEVLGNLVDKKLISAVQNENEEWVYKLVIV